MGPRSGKQLAEGICTHLGQDGERRPPRGERDKTLEVEHSMVHCLLADGMVRACTSTKLAHGFMRISIATTSTPYTCSEEEEAL